MAPLPKLYWAYITQERTIHNPFQSSLHPCQTTNQDRIVISVSHSLTVTGFEDCRGFLLSLPFPKELQLPNKFLHSFSLAEGLSSPSYPSSHDGLSRSRFCHLKNVNKITYYFFPRAQKFMVASAESKPSPNESWRHQFSITAKNDVSQQLLGKAAKRCCTRHAEPLLCLHAQSVDVGGGWLLRSLSPAQNRCRGRTKIILLVQPWFCQFCESAALNNYLFNYAGVIVF